MSKIKDFRDLIIWQKSVDLLKEVYNLTKQKKFPASEQFILGRQIKSAVLSISSNIAEGSSKRSTKEFIRFLNIAYGSLMETFNDIIICKKLGYADNIEDLEIRIQEIAKMINALISSLKKKLNSETLTTKL